MMTTCFIIAVYVIMHYLFRVYLYLAGNWLLACEWSLICATNAPRKIFSGYEIDRLGWRRVWPMATGYLGDQQSGLAINHIEVRCDVVLKQYHWRVLMTPFTVTFLKVPRTGLIIVLRTTSFLSKYCKQDWHDNVGASIIIRTDKNVPLWGVYRLTSNVSIYGARYGVSIAIV